MKRVLLGALLICVCTAIFVVRFQKDRRTYVLRVRSVVVADDMREYLIYAPIAPCANTMPLVIALHSGGGPLGSAERMAALSGWQAIARTHCVIVAFPQGELENPALPPDFSPVGSSTRNIRTWNDGVGVTASSKRGVDDVRFIRTMIDDITAVHPINPARVYATGFSNGATMSFRLGADLSARIAAIAPVSGVLYTDASSSSAVSLFSILGEIDPLPHYGSGTTQKSPIVQDAVSVWAQMQTCGDARSHEKTSSVSIDRFVSCPAGVDVIGFVIRGMGHMYPGHTDLFGSAQGPGSAIDATALIWDFFSVHSKTPAL